jgi:HEAT repeat protein
VLDRLKEAKGVVNTEALATAIPQLSGAMKTRAREALAERLARMTAATLRDKLQDEAAEIRRAAALACAVKADKQFVPDLIPLLEDQQGSVVRAAHAALKDLTGQDLGPTGDANAAARTRAASAWKEWWKKQGGR